MRDKMQIREITHDDVDAVVQLAERCYDEMVFDDYGYRFHCQHIANGFHLSAEKRGCMCWIAVEKNTPVGIIFFTITDVTMYFTDRKTATEIVWHGDPELPPLKRLRIMRKLLKHAQVELKKMNVKVVFVSTDVRYSHPTTMVAKEGFRLLSAYHTKEL
jgi:hypothetical protein